MADDSKITQEETNKTASTNPETTTIPAPIQKLIASYKKIIAAKVTELKDAAKKLSSQQEEVPYPDDIDDQAGLEQMQKICVSLCGKCDIILAETKISEIQVPLEDGSDQQTALTTAVKELNAEITKMSDILLGLKNWVAHLNKANNDTKTKLTEEVKTVKQKFTTVKGLHTEASELMETLKERQAHPKGKTVTPKDNQNTTPKDNQNEQQTTPKDDKTVKEDKDTKETTPQNDQTEQTNDNGTYEKGDVIGSVMDAISGTINSVVSAVTGAKNIYGSVGAGGKNSKSDVKTVQELLNKKGFNLTADGACGPKTIDAIKKFQKTVPGSSCDGRIDVGGKTWKALTASGVIDDKIDLLKEDQGKYDYSQIALKLFSKGSVDNNDIDANDVQQGQIGDCYFMSAIASVARANPDAIRKLIKDKGDGSFDVTLYSKEGKLHLEPTIVNVKPQFPTDADGKPIYADEGDGELWVMILEKAYAKMHGGYDDAGNGGMIEDGLEALTGVEANYYMCSDHTEAQLKQLLADALKAKKPITAASEGSGEKEFKTTSGKTIYQGHAYSVKSMSGDVIELQNPWGHSHANLTVAELKKYFNHIAF